MTAHDTRRPGNRWVHPIGVGPPRRAGTQGCRYTSTEPRHMADFYLVVLAPWTIPSERLPQLVEGEMDARYRHRHIDGP